MVSGIFDDPTRAALASSLDACALRNRIVANNVANADTPGFKRRTVSFEESLSRALTGGTDDITEIQHIKPTVETDQTPSTRPDGNNVNVDKEMAELARNSIKYNALVELYRLKGQMLETVVSGGTK